jgi:hypothetical protein
MIQFNIKSNVDQVEKALSAFAYKQVPFATGRALTALAKAIVPAEQANERHVLDRPKPFTEGAIGVIGASTAKQTATVYMKDITARYLEPYEFGGKNVLNSRAVLTPIDAVADLDQYGNLPRNFLAKLKGRKDIFIGPVQTKSGLVNGVWQRSVAEGAAVPVTKLTKKGVLRTTKTRKRLNTTGKLQLLVKFTDAHDVKQHLGWFVVAKRIVDKGFNREFGKALAAAVSSAK